MHENHLQESSICAIQCVTAQRRNRECADLSWTITKRFPQASGCIDLRTKTRAEQTVFESKQHTGVLNGMKRDPSVQNHRHIARILYGAVRFGV